MFLEVEEQSIASPFFGVGLSVRLDLAVALRTLFLFLE